MAPEVLAKGIAYDSSADWFSFGCMLYKLLKGHSPFRQHKGKPGNKVEVNCLNPFFNNPFYNSLIALCLIDKQLDDLIVLKASNKRRLTKIKSK